MPAISIRDVPTPLYESLKMSAAAIAQILATAPAINKSSRAYLKSEEDILGFGSKGI
jgi:hypothetical protein